MDALKAEFQAQRERAIVIEFPTTVFSLRERKSILQQYESTVFNSESMFRRSRLFFFRKGKDKTERKELLRDFTCYVFLNFIS